MLNLTLADGQPLDIPAASILLLEQNAEDTKQTLVVYSLQPNENLVETVKGNLNTIKKGWLKDNPLAADVIEVTLANEKATKMAFSSRMVIARRGLVNEEHDAKTRLTLNVNGKIVNIQVKDKRDDLVT